MDYYGSPRAVPILKRHLSYYARGYRGAAAFRKALMEQTCIEDVRVMARAFFTDKRRMIDVTHPNNCSPPEGGMLSAAR
jgi:tRNA-dihydrouridine synthase